jgi:hypothetical protein
MTSIMCQSVTGVTNFTREQTHQQISIRHTGTVYVLQHPCSTRTTQRCADGFYPRYRMILSNHSASPREAAGPPGARGGPLDGVARFIIRCCASLTRLSPPPPSSTTSHSAASHAIPIQSRRLPATPLLPLPPPRAPRHAVQLLCLRALAFRSRTASEVRNPADCGAYFKPNMQLALTINGLFRLCDHGPRPSPLHSQRPRLVHFPLRRHVPDLSVRTVTFCDIPSGTTAISRTASCTARCDLLCSCCNHISVRLHYVYKLLTLLLTGQGGVARCRHLRRHAEERAEARKGGAHIG